MVEGTPSEVKVPKELPGITPSAQVVLVASVELLSMRWMSRVLSHDFLLESRVTLGAERGSTKKAWRDFSKLEGLEAARISLSRFSTFQRPRPSDDSHVSMDFCTYIFSSLSLISG
jgi:hypothetical protein